MISYKEALGRHNTVSVKKSHVAETTWKKYQVGTQDFWDNLALGIVVGHVDVVGDYIGIVADYFIDPEMTGVIWLELTPDPTRGPLNSTQETIPTAFSIREEIWMETL